MVALLMLLACGSTGALVDDASLEDVPDDEAADDVEEDVEDDVEEPELDCAAVEAPDRGSRHTMVFLHGMAGDDAFLDRLDYWYGIREALTDAGFDVAMGQADPFQDTPTRAAQWANYLDELVEDGRGPCFNLIGHSQGGLDARYVASKLDPEGRIASVTTIGTPHRGTPVADVLNGLIRPDGITEAIVDAAFDQFARLYGVTDDQDIRAQMDQFTRDNMAAFNEDVVDREDVIYRSWTGRSCGALDLICIGNNSGEVVTPMFGAGFVIATLAEGDNDGLVPVSSGMWGEFLGELPADHLDEVGQLPGTTAPGWDHVAFYLEDAEAIAALGL